VTGTNHDIYFAQLL